MKQNFQTKIVNLSDSGIGCFLSLIIIGLLLSAVGLKWVINSFLILICLLIITPILVVWGFRWWLKRNLVEDNCPVCNYHFIGFNNNNCSCPNCGERLEVKLGVFHRITPEGTIDIYAVEVSSRLIEDEK